jgi:adenine phosphoribosyltransferase
VVVVLLPGVAVADLAAGERFAERVAALVRDVPDYPSPGILFKDITPLLATPAVFREVVDAMADAHGAGSGRPVDVVAGIEARGFILAAPVALALDVPFVPIRKRGKLPHTTLAADYDLEYGTATIEVHTDAVAPGQRVLLVDDVLATGGTAAAACGLLEQLGGTVVGLSVLIELTFLNGRDRLPGRDVRSLLTV